MRKFSRFVAGLVFGALTACLLLFPSVASAQYVAHILVTNTREPRTRKVDPALVDPWGIAHLADGTFWVADQNTSVATAYTAIGKILPEAIEIPCMYNGTPAAPCPLVPPTQSFPPTFGPTGLVSNIYASSDGFEISDGQTTVPATLIFDTIDGLIVGWNPQATSNQGIVAVNNNSEGAHYKGLAIAPSMIGEYLFASNNSPKGGIDLFDSKFKELTTFYPTSTSSSYHPHGVDVIDGKLFATYAGMVHGGILDECNLSASSTPADIVNNCKTLVDSVNSPYTLDAPWGVALAPPDFGKFSNDLLVGNVNTGYIVALNPRNGDFLGDLELPNGQPISYRGMWDLDFEKDRHGVERLYFAAGPGQGKKLFSEGVFGYIIPAGHRG